MSQDKYHPELYPSTYCGSTTQLEEAKDIAIQDCRTLMSKDRTYKGSWRARGGIGVFMMLARKWDRIENFCKENNYDIFEAIIKSRSITGQEGCLEDIRDLRAYLLHVEMHIKKLTDHQEGKEEKVSDGIHGTVPISDPPKPEPPTQTDIEDGDMIGFYQCPVCSRRFSRKEFYDSHVKHAHPGHTPITEGNPLDFQYGGNE